MKKKKAIKQRLIHFSLVRIHQNASCNNSTRDEPRRENRNRSGEMVVDDRV